VPAPDPWLIRQNSALKLRGHGVTLDVAGSRIRLRAVMPPRPNDPPDTGSKQQRISTGLVYPDQASDALQLAEKLGNALERQRVGLEVFDWTPWLSMGRKKGVSAAQSDQTATVSGTGAIRLTNQWWRKQCKRGPSADDSWKVDYQDALSPLMGIEDLRPEHLVALVETSEAASRTRRRVSQATATVARALGWPDDLVSRLREMGKGYSAVKSQSPRDLPSDEVIEELIGRLSATWQWPVAVAAVYGCRPHEALLFADIQPSGVLRVSDGKTGARQSLALPHKWIERWSLQNKRLPAFNPEGSHRSIGALMGQALRRAGAEFRAYDLRHAWAVRAIHHPQITPSLAAKSMGHSLSVHSTVYQRWFDAHQMEAVQSQLNSVV
jgi:integrase